MNAELKRIIKEYTNILEDYLSKSESEEIVNLVFSGYSIKSSTNQANSLFNNSFRIRSAIDRIITYTEKKLTSKKHLRLLLNLAKLSLSKGELFLSSDIYSQVLYRTTNLDNLLEETAYAFQGLGEVSSIQAKWNESFSNVRKAKKIFEKLNNAKGIASCENLLGSFYAEKGDLSSAKSILIPD